MAKTLNDRENSYDLGNADVLYSNEHSCNGM
eukprot:CAMPEP_0174350436 /NCGR_PEP_ID=MMETSP0811_2-20130205/7524_1 /TAXON_ID=73025 ORGANISM="Eutreptiella gymnastica-like, Strain CCMP1594" /NCGR_SAMPLE_ID=MMETSP0811_2 /ASSEMBLY_ACC=CAM_ASM_000667 /LENGTH=30 /DNA_ID= /DNA_START= /DNA_END= /DNA_ORIENTATION=